MGTLIPIGAQVECELQQAKALLTTKTLDKNDYFFPLFGCHDNRELYHKCMRDQKGIEEEMTICGCLVVLPGCVEAVWWSSPLGDMIRAPPPSNDAILGWLPSQLTRQCFISFFRINVCLSSTSKATSQGSVTTRSFIWFIYKPCPCASLSFCTHLAVHGRLHRSSRRSTNDVCKTTAAALAECLPLS